MKRARKGRPTPRRPDHEATAPQFQEAIRAASTVQLVCWKCRYAYEGISPVYAISTNAIAPGGNLIVVIPCPICGTDNEKRSDFHATAADGTQMSSVTLAGLRLGLQDVIDRLQAGKISPEAAAQEVAAMPAMSRLGQWMNRHQVSIAIVMSALSLVLDGISLATALTPSEDPAPSDQYVSPEQVEEIITGVIERLESDSDTQPSPTPSPSPSTDPAP
ncbi:hypothetical protein FQ142_10145 [Microbacterium sp. ANT_H45B]|uniref:hypothetical protein n=1 Tax=Microbacterium sp. ANT_H45B TaxID=2597346 RepID=UPI0011EE5CB3|nr:hypothetical protein [Microbacterium sp. ANT_H45B]KAA0961194.1 hypothetical protein FQ142_10145 [Microbacterium sp. ANT_H45B]